MKRMVLGLLVTTLLGGCAGFDNKVKIDGPTTIRPKPQTFEPAMTGGIYQVANHRPLFEDRRARFVGDTLIVVINEKTSASNQISSSNSRSASATFGGSLIGDVQYF